MSVDLRCGDNIEVLRTLADNSIDSCVTDPPYGLSFMGKRWDYDVPSIELWAEVLRVLKPGGYLLAFAGTRTQHRMACRIEDAGFEIRDMIAWVYGSGFPKSLDVSKAIDRAAGADRDVVGNTSATSGRTVGRGTSDGFHGDIVSGHCRDITAPATDAAREWDGWGTALKPALEPITMARKPFACTVAANVLEHGTGAINVDGCRVGTSKNVPASPSDHGMTRGIYGTIARCPDGTSGFNANVGRWPANLIHDGSPEVLAAFLNDRPGMSGGGDGRRDASMFGVGGVSKPERYRVDSGSAARFFYTAKSSRAERENGLDGMAQRKRDETRNDGDPGGDNPRNRGAQQRANHHPTVKPLDLMRYLVRLVTRKGGVCLDPFMGSGSTGWAARLEGCDFVGIDRDAEYVEIARARIAGHAPLFDDADPDAEPDVRQGTLDL